MLSKIILTLTLASIGIICIAGSAHSKNDQRIIMPTSDALRNRGIALSMDVDELTRLGIFDAFAKKEVLRSEISTLVDDALNACWAEHVKTIAQQASDPNFSNLSNAIIEQARKYKAQRAGFRAAVIEILRQEINAQQEARVKKATGQDTEK